MKYPQPNSKHFNKYTQWLRNIGRAENTIRVYLTFLKIIPKDVEDFFANPNLRAKPTKINAYKSYLSFLYSKLNEISREELAIAKDNLKTPPNRGTDNKWAVPQSQWAQYIRKAPNRVAKMGVWIGFNFGLRLSAIIHLRLEDIQFNPRRILIREHKENKPKFQEAWKPKYNRKRKVPFTKDQAEVFRNWINEYRPHDLLHPYLLWTEKGKYSGDIVQDRTFRNWVYKIHVDLHPHVLRYSFATHYYNKTKDINLVSKLLGHVNVSTTSAYLQFSEQEIMTKAEQVFAEA